MAKKYYAVRQGHIPGIYVTWSECEKQVKGYSGAIYKSFPTKVEAEQFLIDESEGYIKNKTVKNNSIDNTVEAVRIQYDPDVVVAYIDGSFDKQKNAVGSGGIIFYNHKEEEFSFGTTEKQYTDYWNVSGELLATMYVVRYAQEIAAKQVILYYDYMGIEMWATGAWKANNPLTQQYVAFMQNVQQKLPIEFHKVEAHTGVIYNERADKLAKAGVLKTDFEK